VLSSDFDNSPNVLLEAMASGLPIVSTDVGGVREYLKDQVNGLVVPARDAPALARAMTTYADDPDLASRVGRLNRDEAVSTYSWARSTALLRRVFQRIIAQRRDRSVA